MKNQNPISITAACVAAVVLALSGGAAKAEQADKIIAGESITVGAGTVSTWAAKLLRLWSGSQKRFYQPARENTRVRVPGTRLTQRRR